MMSDETFTEGPHTVCIEDWTQENVPQNQQWRAILNPSGSWCIYYGATRQEALDALLKEIQR